VEGGSYAPEKSLRCTSGTGESRPRRESSLNRSAPMHAMPSKRRVHGRNVTSDKGIVRSGHEADYIRFLPDGADPSGEEEASSGDTIQGRNVNCYGNSAKYMQCISLRVPSHLRNASEPAYIILCWTPVVPGQALSHPECQAQMQSRSRGPIRTLQPSPHCTHCTILRTFLEDNSTTLEP